MQHKEATMQGLRTFWQSGWIGKIVLTAAGLCGTMMLCCVGLVAIAMMAPSKPRTVTETAPIQVVAVVPTAKPTIAEIDEPTSAPTAAPTETPAPTATAEPPTSTPLPTPTDEPPTATIEPTAAPTAKPKPTAKPAPAIAIVPTENQAGEPIPAAADVGAAPCQPGQIKGNRNSGIYHAPGQRDYAKSYANVECFNTEAEAQAAGYRRAKR
jgi:hypothetical protein